MATTPVARAEIDTDRDGGRGARHDKGSETGKSRPFTAPGGERQVRPLSHEKGPDSGEPSGPELSTIRSGRTGKPYSSSSASPLLTTRWTVALGAFAQEMAKMGLDLATEARRVGQVVAEDLVHAEIGGGHGFRIGLGLLAEEDKTLGIGVAHVDLVAVLVNARDIAHPAGDAEAEPDRGLAHGDAGRRMVWSRRCGQLLRTVHGDLPGAVLEHRVGITADQGVAIGHEVGLDLDGRARSRGSSCPMIRVRKSGSEMGLGNGPRSPERYPR